MLVITTKSECIGHWTKMRRSRARFSELESSVHTRSLADFITNMFGFRFSVHTAEELAPWREEGGEWQRLRAIFPPYVTTHSSSQIFCFDSARLQRRADYRLVAMGG